LKSTSVLLGSAPVLFKSTSVFSNSTPVFLKNPSVLYPGTSALPESANKNERSHDAFPEKTKVYLQQKNIMVKLFYCLFTGLLISIHIAAFTPEVKSVRLNDGTVIKARLCLPENEVKTIVFCIPGTGPGTYLTNRTRQDF
jgi:hypothetical protein